MESVRKIAKEGILLPAIIKGSIRHRAVVGFLIALSILMSLYAIKNSPLDAIPDISDPQVIIYSKWARSSQLLEIKITRPLILALSGVKGVRTVRGMSYLGYSFVYVIMENNADRGAVKDEVSNRLNSIRSKLPVDSQIEIGPDASSMGWVFQYVLIDEEMTHDLREMRHIQQERVKTALESVEGVAEVATVGGLKKQYQLKIYPSPLAETGVSFQELVSAVASITGEVGGRLLEVNNRDYQVRGIAKAGNIDQIESAVIGYSKNGDPVMIRDIGYIQVGYDLRRGIADFNGEGEVTGGIVIIEQNENVLTVTKRIKEKLKLIEKTLPEGISIKAAYDRSPLIMEAIETFIKTLIYELAVVIVVMVLFLKTGRTVLAPALVLLLSLLFSFLPLYLFHQTLNLFTIAGIFLAMGEMADATIVMVENCVSELAAKGAATKTERRRVIVESVIKMARPLFFSLLIIIVSFLPVFFLGPREGKLFDPLAYGKTFAMFMSTLLTFVFLPGLLLAIFGGKRALPVVKTNGLTLRWYKRSLKTVLKYKYSFLALNIIILIATFPILTSFGKAFMPEMDEGSVLYMPTTLPGMPAREAGWILQKIDGKLKKFPEVEKVFGKLGRADTATDPAPFTMIETVITLRPKSEWRKGMTREKLIKEMDSQMKIPGFVNAWTQPIRARVDMQTTGIQTTIGLKVKGASLEKVETIAKSIEALLNDYPGAKTVIAERIADGYFIDVDFDYDKLAEKGIRVDEALLHVRYALGGDNIGFIDYQGRDVPLSVQYAFDYIDTLEKISKLLIVASNGKVTPLSSVATVKVKRSPEMIRDEDGLLTGYIYIDIDGIEAGTYVERASDFLSEKLLLPEGYLVEWSGQFQYEIEARKKLYIIAPFTLLIIFILLMYTFKSTIDAILIMLSIPYAFVGGIWMQWMLGYPMTIAIWVGYIAVFAVAVQTGIIMIIFLRQALERGRSANTKQTPGDIEAAVIEGSALRLRPKLMTVSSTILSLLPVMLSSGAGIEIMKPIATPTVGGMITSTIYVLFIIPCLLTGGLQLRSRFENG
ncbi:Cobalt-zinc-cadmium resistance protein CzcA; Cation efflux system protein CusA [hydrothermal vent metagenome]|uniref:Cobalt-zinc-cadmium resistance protein CzcA Cation efflux system protein CusA n=1 Tax=hydrothermal vent metagenome TaxID=652676 RepID=A0A3B1CW74_9ZZZZ